MLRANSGAVDATIDQLLSMSVDNQNEKLRNELDGKSPAKKSTTGAATGQLLMLDDKDKRTVQLSTSPTTGASPKIRKPTVSGGSVTASPSTANSRRPKRWDPPILGPLPPSFLRIAPVAGSTDLPLDDEQFAMMLQNEEFMNELRWNQEFLSALEKDKVQGDVPFKDRLRNMGKTSKKKFAQMARVFTFQRNKKPGTNPGLLQEEHSDDDEPKNLKK